MKNASLKLSLLVFILVITSNLGAQARHFTEVDASFEGAAASPEYVSIGDTLGKALSCKRDIDCYFKCPGHKGGFCNERLGRCECL
ncbi:PREDICTED: defensin-like protein 259 [Camelina sativa]|uniref:Defensin-like protein 259 n=1 Tax=Camelina sativa TaxID=90675 RepID=A0ABM1RJ87_CAMSA|nr:PREDICTED: defensin-like protein 259 [Camelina sativa]